MKPLEKSFWDEAGELVHLEGMLAKALHRMHAVARAGSFKHFLAAYRVTVENNLAQLSRTFQLFEVPLREKKNETAIALLQKVQQTILRTDSGPVLDALLLALCLTIIALKKQWYDVIASWARVLSAERRDLAAILKKLHEAETHAESSFQRLAHECDVLAAVETADTTRKRARPTAQQPVQARNGW